MNDVKPWYTSRTMWGALLAAISGFVPLLGTALAIPGVQDGATEVLAGLGATIGGAVAAWGRIKADTTIATPSNPMPPG